MHTSDLSFISLILNASVVVQLVMAILVLASVLSWTIIFDRSRVLKRARREVDDFENRFWSGGDLGDLYRAVDRDREFLRGASAIFHAGFREFARLRENAAVEPLALVEGARRAMRVTTAVTAMVAARPTPRKIHFSAPCSTWALPEARAAMSPITLP